MNYSNKDYIEHLRHKYPPGTRLQLGCIRQQVLLISVLKFTRSVVAASCFLTSTMRMV